MAPEYLGWFASIVLVLTISYQVLQQWESGKSEGVSLWLFIGQIAASIAFTIYSWMLGNWVFIVTNALLLISAVVGLGIVVYHRRRGAEGPREDTNPGQAQKKSGEEAS